MSRDGDGGLPAQDAEGGGEPFSSSSTTSDGDSDDEDEEEDDGGVFTRGDCLRFQLTFGVGPLGLAVADTKAGKGVYVHDFAQVPTRSGPVSTAVELSGGSNWRVYLRSICLQFPGP